MRRLACLCVLFGLIGVYGVAGEVDLLSPAPGAGNPNWQWFCEDPEVSVDTVWSMDDGVLACKGTPKGYLYTARDYTNFVLKLEWRWPADKKPGNGGVLLRTTGPHKCWPKSLEAQLNAGQAGDFWGLAGYPLQGPADRMKVIEHNTLGTLTNLRKTAAAEKKPGEWNTYEIVVRGDTVTLKVNGTEVNQATGCEVVAGRICLTAEGDAYHFRNVRLTPLED